MSMDLQHQTPPITAYQLLVFTFEQVRVNRCQLKAVIHPLLQSCDVHGSLHQGDDGGRQDPILPAAVMSQDV